MKNILALIGLAVVLVVGLGWYLGWYDITGQSAADGHRVYNLDVHVNKIVADEQSLQKKITGAVNTEPKDSTIVPNVSTQKKVDAQPTSGGGLTINPDGSFTITPPYKNVGQ